MCLTPYEGFQGLNNQVYATGTCQPLLIEQGRGTNDSRATQTYPPIPPHNPRAPKFDQLAPITIGAEDNILIFNIPMDNAAHVQEHYGVSQVALDEVGGQIHRVLLDEVEQVFRAGSASASAVESRGTV